MEYRRMQEWGNQLYKNLANEGGQDSLYKIQKDAGGGGGYLQQGSVVQNIEGCKRGGGEICHGGKLYRI